MDSLALAHGCCWEDQGPPSALALPCYSLSRMAWLQLVE